METSRPDRRITENISWAAEGDSTGCVNALTDLPCRILPAFPSALHLPDFGLEERVGWKRLGSFVFGWKTYVLQYLLCKRAYQTYSIALDTPSHESFAVNRYSMFLKSSIASASNSARPGIQGSPLIFEWQVFATIMTFCFSTDWIRHSG
ncbi:hypothetical protein K470DRAFT_101188 [Piedraia hortae CBS 480.64]|uniref:Uncharacterized protein n=1 Tax=Piedraia hortae CBS 480.64 TaxID=1314780 RepID=A0A6A7BXB9_9PEZI|nr:hypothetical protein K470DRAFT_101188 [Piedraia hortae CBS 480.64]